MDDPTQDPHNRQKYAVEEFRSFADRLSDLAKDMHRAATNYWQPSEYAHIDTRAEEIERLARNIYEDVATLEEIYDAMPNVYRQEREAGGDE